MTETSVAPLSSGAPSPADLKRWIDNLQRERASVALLRTLAGRLAGRREADAAGGAGGLRGVPGGLLGAAPAGGRRVDSA